MHFVRAAHVVAHFAQLFNGHARRIHGEQVHAEVLVGVFVDAAAAHAQHVRSAVGAGVEGLVAVDVDLAIALRGGGGHCSAVRASLRLGEAQRERLFALQCVRNDLFLLLFVAKGKDVVYFGREIDPAQGRIAKSMRFFGNHDLRKDIGRRAAQFLGDAQRGETCFYKRLNGLIGELMVLIALPEVGLEIAAFHDGLQTLQKQFLLFCSCKIHSGLPSISNLKTLRSVRTKRAQEPPGSKSAVEWLRRSHAFRPDRPTSKPVGPHRREPTFWLVIN